MKCSPLCPFAPLALSFFKGEEDSLHAVSLEPIPLAGPQGLVTAQGCLRALRVARLPAEPRQEEVRLRQLRVQAQSPRKKRASARRVAFGIDLGQLIARWSELRIQLQRLPEKLPDPRLCFPAELHERDGSLVIEDAVRRVEIDPPGEGGDRIFEAAGFEVRVAKV